MEDYKIETIFAALIGGIGILWHQLITQVASNRSDQKEFSESLQETIKVMSECNELMRDLRDLIKDEYRK